MFLPSERSGKKRESLLFRSIFKFQNYNDKLQNAQVAGIAETHAI
jgi:hypothetical protein